MNCDDLLDFPAGGQKITIVYDENTDNMQRMSVLTLSATDVGEETVTITLTQVGASALPLPPTPPAVLGLPTLAKDIRFYPNPASHTLYIEGISEEMNLIIRALSGKTLLRTTLRQNQAINLSALPQGTYILTLQSAQEQRTQQRTGCLVIGL